MQVRLQPGLQALHTLAGIPTVHLSLCRPAHILDGRACETGRSARRVRPDARSHVGRDAAKACVAVCGYRDRRRTVYFQNPPRRRIRRCWPRPAGAGCACGAGPEAESDRLPPLRHVFLGVLGFGVRGTGNKRCWPKIRRGKRAAGLRVPDAGAGCSTSKPATCSVPDAEDTWTAPTGNSRRDGYIPGRLGT